MQENKCGDTMLESPEITRNGRTVKNVIQRCGCDKILPLALVYVAYIILHGHLSPGGGFQGGILMVAVVLLVYLGHGREESRTPVPARGHAPRRGRRADLLYSHRHGRRTRRLGRLRQHPRPRRHRRSLFQRHDLLDGTGRRLRRDDRLDRAGAGNAGRPARLGRAQRKVRGA